VLPLAAGAELDPEADLSVEDEELDDGALVEPEAEPEAEPEGAAVEPEGAPEEDEDAEPEGDDGVAGVVVEPDEDAEPDGEVVSRVTFGLLPSPQAVIRLAPNARDTATARVFKFMDRLRGWDTGLKDANNGPQRLPAGLEILMLGRLLGVDLTLYRVVFDIPGLRPGGRDWIRHRAVGGRHGHFASAAPCSGVGNGFTLSVAPGNEDTGDNNRRYGGKQFHAGLLVQKNLQFPFLGPIVRKNYMGNILLPTTVVGSYPQPHWLIDRDKLGTKVPRVRAPEIWRIERSFLEEAQDDATLLAIADMERAGIDIITDGEMRRESYSNRFATALEGVDVDHPGTTINRTGERSVVPRIAGPVKRRYAVEVRDVIFLRKNTSRQIKITLPGPFTMAQQAQDDYYKDDEALAMAFAAAVNEEVHELKAAGADVIQLDEPWLQARPEKALRYGVKAINRALQGVPGTTVVHLCFGYASVVKNKPTGYSFLPQLADSIATQISIEAAQPRLDLGILKELSGKSVMLGVIDLNDAAVESAEEVARRAREGLKYVAPERLVLAPDCGMKYIARELAYGKLTALAKGAELLRRELAMQT
jgi:5-methyltetrahydropteroyltriglutamate--homocysteine methyltransferase